MLSGMKTFGSRAHTHSTCLYVLFIRRLFTNRNNHRERPTDAFLRTYMPACVSLLEQSTTRPLPEELSKDSWCALVGGLHIIRVFDFDS